MIFTGYVGNVTRDNDRVCDTLALALAMSTMTRARIPHIVITPVVVTVIDL